MPTPSVLQTRNLTKRFGRLRALDGVDISVPSRAIYGFVGLNGAGKTTTLECCLGLQRADRGEIEVLGRRPRDICRTRGRVGVVFDSPSLHPNLSVRQELDHARIVAGGGGRAPLEVMQLVGVDRWRGMKTRKLSLGNRRRLSIAVALIGSPDLVILDEPFSGLDAAGVEDILSLLIRLNVEEGTTFVVSSHQLHLVERVCNHVGIIHEGRMLVEDETARLLAGERPRLHLSATPLDRALSLLEERGGVERLKKTSSDTLEGELAGVSTAAINAELVRAGVAVTEIVCRRPSLGAFFARLTGRGA